RTRKLSFSAPMVVGARAPVRVGRCQAIKRDNPRGLSFCIGNKRISKVKMDYIVDTGTGKMEDRVHDSAYSGHGTRKKEDRVHDSAYRGHGHQKKRRPSLR
ncbi:hypothetical protein ACIFOT_21930, partial [Neobacillus sp. NRS-1170]